MLGLFSLIKLPFDTSSAHEERTAHWWTHNRTLFFPPHVFVCSWRLRFDPSCLVSCMFAPSTRVTVKCLLCIHEATQASRLNTAFDCALMNACFISLWASETSQELLNNCRKVLRQIRLACPPSVFTFLSLTITLPSVANDFSVWYLFFLLSNLVCCSKCKLLPFPSSWP